MIDKDFAISLCYPSPQQSPEELAFIIDLLNEIKPKKILEIGTGCGALTTVLAMSGARVVTVDWIGNKRQYWQLKKVVSKNLNLDITFHLLNSQREETVDLVRDDYDLVLIDGDHSYAGGYKDWLLYSSMGKVVALHDIVFYENCDENEDWFPRKYWKKIKQENKYRTKEFIDVLNGGWGAIFK